MTLREIFLARDYEESLPAATRARVVIDAGANIGLSAVFFAHRFPGARIIAIEPESANFELLCRNTRPYPNITAVHGALWNRSGQVDVVDPGRGEHGFVTADNRGKVDAREAVPCFSVADLMRLHGLQHVDLLKVDIEGAEKEVFESAHDWIGHVGSVVVELHERFRPGCTQAFMDATRSMSAPRWRGKLVTRTHVGEVS